VEGLLQPVHLFFILLILLLVAAPIIVPIRVARYRRAHCTWPKEKATHRLWIGIVVTVAGVLGPAITKAAGTSPVGIACWFLFVAGIYQVSKAVYRRRDIKEAQNTLSALAPTKP
jgi:hypothetical protein